MRRVRGWVWMVVALALMVWATSPVPAQQQQQKWKVRVYNNTEDVATLRFRCVHFQHDLHFTRDVVKGSHKTVSGVDKGHRGFIVYEDFNKQIILTGSFQLPAAGMNVKVAIFGNERDGYRFDSGGYSDND